MILEMFNMKNESIIMSQIKKSTISFARMPELSFLKIQHLCVILGY